MRDGILYFGMVEDAASAGATCEAARDAVSRPFHAAGFEYADFIKEIDILYQDPANVILPVTVLYAVAAGKFRGEPISVTQSKLAKLRKLYQELSH